MVLWNQLFAAIYKDTVTCQNKRSVVKGAASGGLGFMEQACNVPMVPARVESITVNLGSGRYPQCTLFRSLKGPTEDGFLVRF